MVAYQSGGCTDFHTIFHIILRTGASCHQQHQG
jgi:hypothetical protein